MKRSSSTTLDKNSLKKKTKREMVDIFYKACREGNAERVEQLLTTGSVDVAEHNTSLHEAATHGHVDVVSVLIQNDADVNARIPQRRYSASRR